MRQQQSVEPILSRIVGTQLWGLGSKNLGTKASLKRTLHWESRLQLKLIIGFLN